MNIKAVIFDWARTLFDRENNSEFAGSEELLIHCKNKGYKLGLVSLLTKINSPDATVEDRLNEIENSPLRKYFEIALVTDQDKNKLFDQTVEIFNLPRNEILIIDDRTARGIKYANERGHPSIWIQKGKFANELPDDDTGQPSYIVKSLGEIKNIL